MTIKVIASDMDGTFLDDKGSYDKERFIQILDAMAACDMHFVVASGNSMSRLKPMFAETFDRLHFVAENGGQVVSYGKLLCQEFMASNDVENLLSYFNYDLLDKPTIFNGSKSAYMLSGTKLHFGKEMITEEEQAAMEASIHRLNRLEDLEDDFIKITMLLSPDEANQVSQAFNRDFDGNPVAVPSGFGAIDFIKKGMHKAWGLKQLLNHWDLNEANVMAFGDGDNDIELLRMASHSYAMENASPALLQVADQVAPHHKDRGVLTILEDYLGLY